MVVKAQMSPLRTRECFKACRRKAAAFAAEPRGRVQGAVGEDGRRTDELPVPSQVFESHLGLKVIVFLP